MTTIRRCAFYLLPLACGCLASMVRPSAQSQETLVLEHFSERLSRDVPVSGRLLVGAVVAPGAASLSPRLLWRGAGLESTKEPLCVTLVSRDGQYFGEGEISPGTLLGLRGSVRVEGNHRQSEKTYLVSLHGEELAMLATSGDCRLGAADGKTTVHLLDRGPAVPSAGQTQAADFVVQLMLNSMTYTLSVEASIPGVAGVRLASCRTLGDDKRNTAFDTVCALTLPNSATEATLIVKRRRFERSFSPVEFKLAWAPT